MGAGVGKPQEAPRSSRNSNSGSHQNQSRTAQNELSDEMSCEGCSIRFSLLKRKKPCCECLKNHCSACLIKSPATNGVRRRCQKCQLLVSGRFTRHDLTDYKAKDLRQFLIRRNVPVTNCTEKSDLVELLLKFNNSSQYRLEQELSNRRTQELQERSRYQDQLSEHDSAQPVPNVSDNTSASNTPIHASTNSHSTQNPEEAFPEPPSYQDVTSGVLHQGSGEAETGEPTVVVEQDQNPDIEINVDGDDPSDNNTPQPVRRERARIENVPSLEAIDDLTVKQLKEILAMNFVNYKGCVEKWELVDRVKRLWQDTKDNQRKAEEIESKEYASSHQASGTGAVSGESELCKICMECVIDCVLLECGHMVTCTQCGKRMSECPICRQYVIRVVHVFKS